MRAAKEPFLKFRSTGEVVPLAGRDGAFVVGRDTEADHRVPLATCSRRQFRLVRVEDSTQLELLSTSVPTTVNGEPLHDARRLETGDVIGFAGVEAEYHEAPPPDDATVVGGLAALGGPVAPVPSVVVSGDRILGRDPDRADVHLDHPRVSRVHAEVVTGREGVRLRDLGSSNGTFVNGERVTEWRTLLPGDRIGIGPYELTFTGEELIGRSRAGNVSLAARGLTREVRVADGGRRTILEDASFLARPCELVCILGSTGCGKSTLLDALSGRRLADRGEVIVNGLSLARHYEALKRGLALVPQESHLPPNLTLGEALLYTARLRLPADLGLADAQAEVVDVLRRVDLAAHTDTRVRNLSGGQKRRAALANELLGRPELLFVDEVTSGLDEGMDREMMSLLRSLADDGVTVVCVTHKTENVARFAHRVVVMAPPGVAAFSGPPDEAPEFFGVERLGQIYDRLRERPATEWRASYRATPGAADEERRVDAALRAAAAGAPPPTPLDWRETLLEGRRQLRILFSRSLRLLVTDRRAAWFAVAQAGFVGAVIAAVFGRLEPDDPREIPLLFFTAISVFWFGCNSASKSIVGERRIYEGERGHNLSVGAYVLAKAGVELLQGLVLLVLLAAVVSRFAVLPGEIELLALHLGATLLAGVGLGLLISAVARTRAQANAVLPLALIPQIVLSGFVVERLPELPDIVARTAVSGFWIHRGGKLGALVGDTGESALAVGILLVHALALVALTFGVLVLRDRKPTPSEPGRARPEIGETP